MKGRSFGEKKSKTGLPYVLRKEFPHLITNFDRLYNLVLEKKRVKISEAALQFNVKKEKVEEWGRILEEYEMLEMHYPFFGETVISVVGLKESLHEEARKRREEGKAREREKKKGEKEMRKKKAEEKKKEKEKPRQEGRIKEQKEREREEARRKEAEKKAEERKMEKERAYILKKKTEKEREEAEKKAEEKKKEKEKPRQEGRIKEQKEREREEAEKKAAAEFRHKERLKGPEEKMEWNKPERRPAGKSENHFSRIVDYVKRQMKAGFGEREIRKVMLQHGYAINEINRAIDAAKKEAGRNKGGFMAFLKGE